MSPPPALDSGTRMPAYTEGVKVNRSMAWAHFGRALLLVQAPGIPGDADWTEFIADSDRDPGEAIVVIADETRLSPKQRVEVQAWQERHGTPAILVSDSLVTRGVAKALSWFGVKIYPFARREIDRALHCAGIPTADHADAKALIERMTKALEQARRQPLAG
jgi:hypothetical protein